ncbi:vitellogenin receptor-like [Planococcus citri]|uniref:vitellogenin receptor-like n=1 Tax=Planococcus citri TaxID=170843 RepID=UPI0031F8FC1E
MDCPDRSDEGIGCYWRGGCGKRRFTCFNAVQCVMPSDLCDKQNQCNDGSDEWNCGDQLNTENCSLSDGKFLCHDKKRCLDLENTCDGYFNCFDDSDENSNCTKYDSVAQECPSTYISTPEGPICPCNYSNGKLKEICAGIQNCTGASPCDQNCHMFKGKKYCSCFEDYHPVPNSNGHKCQSNELLENIILYSTITRIKSLNLTTNRTSTLTSGVNCTALAAAHDHVYYATSQQGIKNYILKIPINSNLGRGEKLFEQDSVVTSISVDYITNNIYFIANESLFVCTNNSGRICSRLKCCGIGSVVLAPKFGVMFYTMKTYPSEGQGSQYHVMKSNMDGEDEGIFVDDIFSDLKMTLIVNERMKKVLCLVQPGNYFTHVTFECTTLDGSEKETRNLHWGQILSISALNEKLFFSEKNSNLIYSVNNSVNMSDSAGTVYFRDLISKKLNLLHAHNKRFHRFNENPCATASCPGLCLLRPTSFTDSSLNYTCILDSSRFSNENHPTNENNSKLDLDSFLTKMLILLLIVTIVGCGVFLCHHKCNLRRYYSMLSIWKSSPEEQVEMVQQKK